MPNLSKLLSEKQNHSKLSRSSERARYLVMLDRRPSFENDLFGIVSIQ